MLLSHPTSDFAPATGRRRVFHNGHLSEKMITSPGSRAAGTSGSGAGSEHRKGIRYHNQNPIYQTSTFELHESTIGLDTGDAGDFGVWMMHTFRVCGFKLKHSRGIVRG